MTELKSDPLVNCTYCQRNFTTLFEFKDCGHKICISCLFQRIFLYNKKKNDDNRIRNKL